MNQAGSNVLTTGHSTHVLKAFVALLQLHDVAAVADVRSAPYSRFNREPFAEALGAEGIRYVYPLGRVVQGAARDPIALIGARDEEPLDCHRTLLDSLKLLREEWIATAVALQSKRVTYVDGKPAARTGDQAS